MWTHHDYDDYPGWVWLLLAVMYVPFLIWVLVRRHPIPVVALVLLVAVVATLI